VIFQALFLLGQQILGDFVDLLFDDWGGPG